MPHINHNRSTLIKDMLINYLNFKPNVDSAPTLWQWMQILVQDSCVSSPLGSHLSKQDSLAPNRFPVTAGFSCRCSQWGRCYMANFNRARHTN